MKDNVYDRGHQIVAHVYASSIRLSVSGFVYVMVDKTEFHILVLKSVRL